MASALHRSQHQLRTAEEWLTFDSCLHKTQKCNNLSGVGGSLSSCSIA